MQASHSSSLLWLSEEPPTLGYALTLINLGGSLLFFVASACYFIQVPPVPTCYFTLLVTDLVLTELVSSKHPPLVSTHQVTW